MVIILFLAAASRGSGYDADKLVAELDEYIKQSELERTNEHDEVAVDSIEAS